MWCVYTMDRNQLVRKSEMWLTGQWMEPEIIIRKEVTQTPKTNTPGFLPFVDVSLESLGVCISFGIPTEVKRFVGAVGVGAFFVGDINFSVIMC